MRDLGLLDAACARPRSTAFGADAYPTVGGKAAALLHSLARNHGLVDGNKRLAWLAALVFLDINGHTVELDDESAFQLVMAVAEGTLEVDDIPRRLGGSVGQGRPLGLHGDVANVGEVLDRLEHE